MSSSAIQNVIIIGAGGNLGPSILKAFLEESKFNISILSREGSKSTFPEGVKVHRADYSSVESLTSAFKGQDAVLSIVGGAAFGDQNKLIDAAIAAGVKRFLPSEYGSNTLNPKLRTLVPVFNAKLSAVEYLKSKEDVISWSSVITGPFFDWGVKVGFLGINTKEKTARIIDGGDVPFTATNLRTIGRAVVKILENPDSTKNQYVTISSFKSTQNEILGVAEKIYGSKFTVNPANSADIAKSGQEKLSKGDHSGIAELIIAGIWGKDELGDNTELGLWNDKLGLPKDDLEESVKAGLNGKLVGEN